jgi:hypothetical protein
LGTTEILVFHRELEIVGGKRKVCREAGVVSQHMPLAAQLSSRSTLYLHQQLTRAQSIERGFIGESGDHSSDIHIDELSCDVDHVLLQSDAAL